MQVLLFYRCTIGGFTKASTFYLIASSSVGGEASQMKIANLQLH